MKNTARIQSNKGYHYRRVMLLAAGIFACLAAAGCLADNQPEDQPPSPPGDDYSGVVPPEDNNKTYDYPVGTGTRYYVSMTDGDDSNDGLSPQAPFKTLAKAGDLVLGAGDQVLFKAGDIWFCADESPRRSYCPKGMGAEGNPVIIGVYGSGPRPVINGSSCTEAVQISIPYITVRDLELTNDDMRGWNGDENLKGPQSRRGVYVYAVAGYGEMAGISLINLKIHDVLGWAIHANDSSDYRPQVSTANWAQCGGIFIQTQTWNVTLTGSSGISWLKDTLIQDCYIYDVSCAGIYANGNAWVSYSGPGVYIFNRDMATGMPYTNRGLVIRNTVIRNTGGEGMNLCDGMWDFTIDGCGLYDIGYDPRGLGKYIGAVYSGNNSVIQNCEIARTWWSGDSHAFDQDVSSYGIGLIQYNYVHDCTGSFFMNWPGGTHEAALIARYNISVNNVHEVDKVTFILGTSSNAYFYNNVFYNDNGWPFGFSSSNNDRAVFANNVFCTNSDKSILDLSKWNRTTPVYFINNCYYGFKNAPVTGAGYNYPSIAGGFSDTSKLLVNPGYSGAPKGSGASADLDKTGYDGIINAGGLRDIRSLASMFKITEDSPLFHAGRGITKTDVNAFLWGISSGSTAPDWTLTAFSSEDFFDINAGKDFFGDTVTVPSVGAHCP